MIIIEADYHPGFQQIAFVDTDTGEFQERRDCNIREEAEKFRNYHLHKPNGSGATLNLSEE